MASNTLAWVHFTHPQINYQNVSCKHSNMVFNQWAVESQQKKMKKIMLIYKNGSLMMRGKLSNDVLKHPSYAKFDMMKSDISRVTKKKKTLP